MNREITEVAPGLWRMAYPLDLMGIPVGRQVTLIGLPGGKLLIHSTAPFAESDLEAIRALGEPAALVDVTCFHDSYARAGREAFPELPYFVPENFPQKEALSGRPIDEMVKITDGAVEILPIAGMPKVNEYALYHPQSKTLVVADLCFNFGAELPRVARWFFRWVGGIRKYPGMSRFFRLMIRDRAAFEQSLTRIFQRDFDRLIVAHGAAIDSGAKEALRSALSRAGFRCDMA